MRITLLVASALSLLMLLPSVGCSRAKSADPPPNMAVVAELRKSTGGPAATGAVAATGTGWGTIKGRFVFDGAAPAAANLDVNKDVEICGKHKLVDESLVVGSTKGLANVAIFVRGKTRVHPDVASAATGKVEYDNKGCRFEPHVLALPITKTIVIKNSDPIGHNSNISPPGDAAANPLIPSNGEYEHKFGRGQTEGVSITCNIHPWMKGYVLPRDNPYVIVTKDDGSFELTNVPAGEDLEFQIWHERAPKGLEVDSSWAKGRKKLKVEDQKTLDLGELKVSAAALK